MIVASACGWNKTRLIDCLFNLNVNKMAVVTTATFHVSTNSEKKLKKIEIDLELCKN